MSEIAQVRAQIAQEQAAAVEGLYGLARVASHEVITARMERMANHIQQLINRGHEKEAKELLQNDQLWSEEIVRRMPPLGQHQDKTIG